MTEPTIPDMRSRISNTQREVCERFVYFISQNNKSLWSSNVANTFVEKFKRCTKVCGLFFLDCAFWILIGWADKLRSRGRQLNFAFWPEDDVLSLEEVACVVAQHKGGEGREEVAFCTTECFNHVIGYSDLVALWVIKIKKAYDPLRA